MFCPKCGEALPEDTDYCPECGQRVTTAEIFVAKRPGVITAAAIICGVLGALILFSTAGFLTKAALDPKVSLATLFNPLTLSLLISLILILGGLYIIAGGLLWKSRRSGGIIGITLGALRIISSFIIFSGLGFIGIIPDIAIIVLIGVGWSKLR